MPAQPSSYRTIDLISPRSDRLSSLDLEQTAFSSSAKRHVKPLEILLESLIAPGVKRVELSILRNESLIIYSDKVFRCIEGRGYAKSLLVRIEKCSPITPSALSGSFQAPLYSSSNDTDHSVQVEWSRRHRVRDWFENTVPEGIFDPRFQWVFKLARTNPNLELTNVPAESEEAVLDKSDEILASSIFDQIKPEFLVLEQQIGSLIREEFGDIYRVCSNIATNRASDRIEIRQVKTHEYADLIVEKIANAFPNLTVGKFENTTEQGRELIVCVSTKASESGTESL